MEKRDYQYNYTSLKPSLFNSDRRLRKAATIVRVCQDFAQPRELSELSLLDVGSSNGIIDNYLADYFRHVSGIDIDEPAMDHARKTFQRDNLSFEQGDAMAMAFPDDQFDVAVCTQIYEHVPDAGKMLEEIFRVLKPGGFCYFSGNNRIMFMEPHYRLPLLSVMPRQLAHHYVRATGKGSHYHELHFTYWTLKRLCRKFNIVDYSPRVISDPAKYGVDYMVQKGSPAWRVAHFLANHAKWASPMLWILQKPTADQVAVN
ncbi:MAG: class I SAM-dependent methyltransferase [Halieaceae bacterium]|jgi:2-polyprenyl-3-methyl-5-hydroxy-6-metoxy-1,4-benzoquinol methylase|nr:class I SAM-dependent methyltransferase [Halieaceae bacterium]